MQLHLAGEPQGLARQQHPGRAIDRGPAPGDERGWLAANLVSYVAGGSVVGSRARNPESALLEERTERPRRL
jgi:hypothetical protein